MNAHLVRSPSSEKVVRVLSGWLMLPVTLGIVALALYGIGYISNNDPEVWPAILIPIGLVPLFVISCFGFFTLQPNEARVLILFGSYQGTVRHSGFHWTNPFNRKLPISLRAPNFQSR